jgi:hypothetical protein
MYNTDTATTMISGNHSRLCLPPVALYLILNMNWNEIRQNAVNLIRSALIGTSIGVLPGIGGAASNLIACAVARKSSPSPETFGKAQIPTPGKANAMNLNDTANFIGGEWVKSPDTCPNINPSDTGDVINQMPHASLAELEQAIEADFGPWIQISLRKNLKQA